MSAASSFSHRAPALAGGLMLLALAWGSGLSAHAALLEDTEARRAILELREKVQRQSEEFRTLQRSVLDQQTQFDALRAETARLRGEKEELSLELRRAKEQSQGVDERLKKLEPVKVKVDGVEFMAEPADTKAYDEALALLRRGDFVGAASAFNDLIRHSPRSGYALPALFWLGNAQYASRDYANALKNFNSLLSIAPTHARAADAMLSVANCQLELKDLKGARKTLAEVSKNYPGTEAASAAAERLGKLK